MSETKKKIYLASPHLCGLEKQFVKEAFDTNWIAPLGPNVDAFEREVAEIVGAKGGAALSSGTAGIHLALKYLGVSRGDLVFCSDLTFAASCNPIIYEGAIPVFIDSEPETWNMSPTALKKAFEACESLRKLPKAVVVVDLYGQSADFDSIREICSEYGVPIVEDAAEALGSTYKGRSCGTLGDIGVLSFNGNKIITTSSGGMLLSQDEAVLKKIKFWATQSRDEARHYQHSELGYNYRMSNILAGIGRGQLRILGDRVMQKKNIYETYKNGFSELEDIKLMPIAEYGQSNYWLSVITIKEESNIKPLDIITALEEENIESRPTWKPMHLQPFFEKYDFYSYREEGSSVSEDIFYNGVCIPSDTKMTISEQGKVIDIIRELFFYNNEVIKETATGVDKE